MSRNGAWAAVSIVVLSLLLAALLSNDRLWTVDTAPREITVILRGKSGDGRKVMRMGMEQAAADMGVELHTAALTEENSVTEQQFLLRQALENGTDAVLISVSDGARMAHALEEASRQAPLVAFESGADTAALSCVVAPDDRAMGRDLAKRAGAQGSILVLLDGSAAFERERLAGFREACGDAVTLEIRELAPGSDPYPEVRRILARRPVAAVAALNAAALESAARAVEDLGFARRVKLSGIGGGYRIAPYMETGVIQYLVVPRDYSTGYLAVQAAVREMDGGGGPARYTVGFQGIPAENMFDTENQWLLFPFVH